MQHTWAAAQCGPGYATLILPYANLFWTGVLSVIIGLILAPALSASLVYAQELIPGRIGLISGLFFGIAFGMGGLGAATLGRLAERDGHHLRLSGLRFPPCYRNADRVLT